MTNKDLLLQQLLHEFNKVWFDAGQLHQVATAEESEHISEARLMILDAYLIFRKLYHDIPRTNTSHR